MSAALIVLNPRAIPECLAAIRALDIPTCWLSYMTEAQAAEAANQQIQDTSHDHYIVVSDDTIPTQAALDLILEQARQGHPVVTGYCNLDENTHRHLVNLTSNPLPPPPAGAASYRFLRRAQVEAAETPTITTTFAGLALTLATRQTLLDHPLAVEPSTGHQMDYDLSYRLAQAGVPIAAAVGAYVHHVKETWCELDKNPAKQLLVGQHPPNVSWTNSP